MPKHPTTPQQVALLREKPMNELIALLGAASQPNERDVNTDGWHSDQIKSMIAAGIADGLERKAYEVGDRIMDLEAGVGRLTGAIHAANRESGKAAKRMLLVTILMTVAVFLAAVAAGISAYAGFRLAAGRAAVTPDISNTAPPSARARGAAGPRPSAGAP